MKLGQGNRRPIRSVLVMRRTSSKLQGYEFTMTFPRSDLGLLWLARLDPELSVFLTKSARLRLRLSSHVSHGGFDSTSLGESWSNWCCCSHHDRVVSGSQYAEASMLDNKQI